MGFTRFLLFLNNAILLFLRRKQHFMSNFSLQKKNNFFIATIISWDLWLFVWIWFLLKMENWLIRLGSNHTEMQSVWREFYQADKLIVRLGRRKEDVRCPFWETKKKIYAQYSPTGTILPIRFGTDIILQMIFFVISLGRSCTNSCRKIKSVE